MSCIYLDYEIFVMQDLLQWHFIPLDMVIVIEHVYFVMSDKVHLHKITYIYRK